MRLFGVSPSKLTCTMGMSTASLVPRQAYCRDWYSLPTVVAFERMTIFEVASISPFENLNVGTIRLLPTDYMNSVWLETMKNWLLSEDHRRKQIRPSRVGSYLVYKRVACCLQRPHPVRLPPLVPVFHRDRFMGNNRIWTISAVPRSYSFQSSLAGRYVHKLPAVLYFHLPAEQY